MPEVVEPTEEEKKVKADAEEAKRKARSERFGVTEMKGGDEALNKRAERFGLKKDDKVETTVDKVRSVSHSGGSGRAKRADDATGLLTLFPPSLSQLSIDLLARSQSESLALLPPPLPPLPQQLPLPPLPKLPRLPSSRIPSSQRRSRRRRSARGSVRRGSHRQRR